MLLTGVSVSLLVDGMDPFYRSRSHRDPAVMLIMLTVLYFWGLVTSLLQILVGSFVVLITYTLHVS